MRQASDRELFAAGAADNIAAAQALAEHARESFEHPVAGYVTIGVVDPLEIVEVKHAQCERFLFPLHAREFGFDLLARCGVIEQSGQTVAQH